MAIDKYSGGNYSLAHVKRVEGAQPIDRTTQWGNPFPLRDPKDDKLRQECVQRYKTWLWNRIESGNTQMLDDLIQIRHQSGGHLTLGCWCAPRLYHGDVLAEACDLWESKQREHTL